MAETPCRILLVEDNAGDARLLRELLRDAAGFDHSLTCVDRLAAAQPVLEQVPAPDVILLDLSLPDAHGLETVERASAIAPDHPIIVLTGLNDETTAVQAVQAGAQDYLVKGQFDTVLLVRAIRYALERKRLDRERLHLLEREQEARRRAEIAVRARDDVLRVVSHDLGNSLSAIVIHTMVLLRTLENADEACERIAGIQELARQMQRLRQDLLDVAIIDEGRLTIEREPLAAEDLVQTIVKRFEPLAHEKSIRLSGSLDGPVALVWADQERILQILANLVGNAVKFTPVGGSIDVEVKAGEEGTRFSVHDNGPGIAPEHLPHIFDRFWKVRERNRAGSGLGLAIARGIVEAHGGRLWAESGFGRGASFYFLITHHL